MWFYALFILGLLPAECRHIGGETLSRLFVGEFAFLVDGLIDDKSVPDRKAQVVRRRRYNEGDRSPKFYQCGD